MTPSPLVSQSLKRCLRRSWVIVGVVMLSLHSVTWPTRPDPLPAIGITICNRDATISDHAHATVGGGGAYAALRMGHNRPGHRAAQGRRGASQATGARAPALPRPRQPARGGHVHGAPR